MPKGENVRKSKINKAARRKDGLVVTMCQEVFNNSTDWRLRNLPPEGLGTYERNRHHINVPGERKSTRIGFTYWMALEYIPTGKIIWFPTEVWYWTQEMFKSTRRAQLKVPFPKAARLAGQKWPLLNDTVLFIGGKLVLLGWGTEYARKIMQISIANLSDLRDYEIHPSKQNDDPKQVMVDINRIVEEEGNITGWRWISSLHTQGPLHEYIVSRILELLPQIRGEAFLYEDREKWM